MTTLPDLEAAKLAAEIAKLEAEATATRETALREAEKLRAETHEIEKPFWHRPGFYAALLPVLATVGTIAWTLYSGTLKEFLKAQETKAQAELRFVQAETKLLEYDRKTFAAEVAALQAERNALKRKSAEFEQAIAASQERLASLEAQLERAPLDAVIATLHEDSALWEDWQNSDFERLTAVIKDYGDPAEAMEIVRQGMADTEALQVRAKLLYSFYRATGEETYLDDLRGLIPEAVAQNLRERSFWSLFTAHWDSETVQMIEPRAWLVGACADAFSAFAASAEKPDERDPTWRRGVLDAFSAVNSGCADIVKQDPGAIPPGAVSQAAAAAAKLYSPDLSTYDIPQLAELIAARNRFAAKLIAAQAWSMAGFRTDVTFIMGNVLEYDDPNFADPRTSAPEPAGWREFLAEHGHLLDTLHRTPFDAWPVAPAE